MFRKGIQMIIDFAKNKIKTAAGNTSFQNSEDASCLERVEALADFIGIIWRRSVTASKVVAEREPASVE